MGRRVRSGRPARCGIAAQTLCWRCIPKTPAAPSWSRRRGCCRSALNAKRSRCAPSVRSLPVLLPGPDRRCRFSPYGARKLSGMEESMTRIAFAFAMVLSLGASAAIAQDYSIGSIQVAKPWTRATPKGAKVAGAYMSITNKGTAPDRLVGGATSAAAGFEVHNMTMDQGVAKMRPVEGGLEIKPGETVELRPGSFHVMLTGLKQPLEKGQKVKATLQFEKAGKVDIEYAVEAAGTPSAPASGGHNH